MAIKMLAQLWTKDLCISNYNKSTKKLLFFFIPLFLLSSIVIAADWTGYGDQTAAGNITIAITNISAANSTFAISCAGGTANYDIYVYLDGALDYTGDDWTDCNGYYWHAGLDVGYHIVYIQARDQDGVCIDGFAYDGVTYCDNDKFGNSIAFGINPVGSIQPFNITLSDNSINRYSSAGVTYTNIFGGTPPYTMTFKAYAPGMLYTLSTWYLSVDNQTVYPVLYGSSLPSLENDKNYSIITVVTDSAGNSRDYGNYIPDTALVRLNIIGDGTTLAKVSFTKKDDCSFYTFEPPLYCNNTANDEVTLSLSLSGSDPKNVSIGYYNATVTPGLSSPTIRPICSWINSYKTNFSVTVLPSFSKWNWAWVGYNNVNGIAEVSDTVYNDVWYLKPVVVPTVVGGAQTFCYAVDPSVMKIKGCTETGGQLNTGFSSSRIIAMNDTDFVKGFTGYSISCFDYRWNSTAYWNNSLAADNPGIYQYVNGSIRTVTGNWTNPSLPPGNPIVSWSASATCNASSGATADIEVIGGVKLSLLLIILIVAIGIFAEVKAHTGGVVIGIILIVGLIMLAYYHIISAWIPIVCGIMIALIVAFFGRKMIKGG